MNRRPCCAFILVCLMTLFARPALASDGLRLHFWAGWHGRSDHSLDHVPLAYRTVPPHPDDTWIVDRSHMTDTIPDQTLSFQRPDNQDIGVDYRFLPFLGAGLIASFPDQAASTFDWSQVAELNQYGRTGRGDGMSLRYYRIKVPSGATRWLASGFVSTPWLHLARPLALRFSGGGWYDLSGFPIELEAGWDRWSSFQPWQRLGLGRIYEDRWSSKLEVGITTNQTEPRIYFTLFAGLQFPHYRTRFGDLDGVAIGLNPDPAWTFGLGYGR